MNSKPDCYLSSYKELSALSLVNEAIHSIRAGKNPKLNAIWLETTGCSGNIISLLDAANFSP